MLPALFRGQGAISSPGTSGKRSQGESYACTGISTAVLESLTSTARLALPVQRLANRRLGEPVDRTVAPTGAMERGTFSRRSHIPRSSSVTGSSAPNSPSGFQSFGCRSRIVLDCRSQFPQRALQIRLCYRRGIEPQPIVFGLLCGKLSGRS